VFGDEPGHPGELGAAEPAAVGEPDGAEPELGPALVALDLDVGRLRAVAGVKEEGLE
jgi:hypothetical protein